MLKDYIWGGRNLERLGRRLPPGVIAESWDIAAHENGMTMVDNGRYSGKLLTEVQQELGLDLIGRNCAWAQERGKFPLLIKLLDANRPLSVQVHPNDDYALANEGNELGKTEMWVVLHAEPGARLILGVKPGTSRASFRQAILDGRLEPLMHSFPVRAGDHICVPAGSLHAIMGGLIIAEIQQNSDTTYRVYDWNRPGADGRPRPLHVEKALDVINFQQVEPGVSPAALVAEEGGISRYLLCKNRYFVTERVELAKGSTFQGNCNGDSLEIWGVLEGNVQIGDLSLDAIRFTLLPAALGEFEVTASLDSVLLRTYVEAAD
ncbi:MAG: class I mannose-6-phosphate isomerase [Chloroflexota bacterium]|nr:MAG: class I mannose-6-phosphate isomerase [Chloroflexota bacterium]